MDAIARTLGEVASRKLGQPFIVENKAGAGGNIGADYVAKQPADGYTLMITSIGMATNGALYNKLSYNPIKDFAPVSLLAVVPNVLVVSPHQKDIKSAKDLVAKAQQNPDKLTYASAGNGTSIHLAGANFTALTGVKMLHIPYRGSGPAITDLLGGQVDVMFDSITSARPHIQAGKLKALGVTTKTRSTSLPDVPTLAEAGITGYEVSPWFAAFMPAGTPPAIVEKLGKTLNEAMTDPEVKKRLDFIGAEPIGSTPQALGQHLKAETERWTALIKSAGITAD
ncbi:MAG: tripartite tricarboxylate transporter substrate binding protein, partial [Comamonas sp.]